MLLTALMMGLAALQPTPECKGEAYDDFDFWLGEWEVTTPNGEVAGRNVIEKAENGCLMIERWTGTQGTTGQSYNYYDPDKEEWRQVWVSPQAVIDYDGGLNDDGEMRLEGKITYRNGTSLPFRGTWTPNEDGTVRQVFEQADPESGMWLPWFEGLYTKAD